MTAALTGLLTFLSYLLRPIPYRWSLAFGSMLGTFFYRVVGFRRQLVLENLGLAYPACSPEELDALALENYRHYGKMLVDFLLSLTWTAEDYRRQVPIDGLEEAKRLVEQGKGCFFLTFHLGSWELSLGAAAAHGLPIQVVVKRAKSPLGEKLLQWYRGKVQAQVLVESGSHHQILQAVSQGNTVAYLLDQFMGPPIGLPVTFFGREAGTAASLALLLERREVPVLVGYIYRQPDGSTRIRIHPPFVFANLSEDRQTRFYQRTQQLNDAMERIIRKYPEQWLWLHRRWKPYRGEPRWKPATQLSGLLAALLLWGCASAGPEQTGIQLPPDPKISVPEVSVVSGTPAATAHAESLGIVEPKKPEKKKSKKKKAEKTPPPAPPAAKYVMVEHPRLPFEVGERMEIELNWMALPAGRVVLEVRKGEPINGRETLHLWGNLLSSKLVDAIYHVDNTVESIIDAKGAVPYKFLLHMVESSQKKETRVAFDHLNEKAFYWSKRLSQKWGDETLDLTDKLVPGAKDMYSGVYALRMQEYELNKPVRIPVYEKSKNLEVIITPVANELVNSKVGVFQCWKLSVQVSLNNNLQQTGESYMWLSDDSKRYLVKFDAKVKIGSLRGALVEVKEK